MPTSDGLDFVQVVLHAELVEFGEEVAQHAHDFLRRALGRVLGESLDVRVEDRHIGYSVYELLYSALVLEELGQHVGRKQVVEQQVLFVLLRVQRGNGVKVVYLEAPTALALGGQAEEHLQIEGQGEDYVGHIGGVCVNHVDAAPRDGDTRLQDEDQGEGQGAEVGRQDEQCEDFDQIDVASAKLVYIGGREG